MVADYYPELVDFFKNPEEAKTVSIRSDKKVAVKCPNCGHEHIMIVKNLTRRHYNCPVCGSKTSFGERLLLAIFDNQNIEYIYQLNNKTFKWADKYKYDFYLPEKNIIIEIHGSQHTKQQMGYKGCRTLFEEQENDAIKKKLAFENGIDDIIYIDYSNRDILIYKNEINTKLKDIINTDNIDWMKCVKIATSSKLIKSIKIWEEYKNEKTTKEIAKIIGVHSGTLVNMLHTGNSIGLCIYDSQEERRKQNKKNGEKIKQIRTKKINVYTSDNVFLGTFEGARYICEHSKELFGVDTRYQDIISVCNNRQKTHRNLKFVYYDKDKRNQN